MMTNAKQTLLNELHNLIEDAAIGRITDIVAALDLLHQHEPVTYSSLLGNTLVNDLFRLIRAELDIRREG